MQSLIRLGKTEILLPPLGVGTWQWGDTLVWGYGKGYSEADLRAAFEASVQQGVTFFDTAEVYGFGRSERFLGQFVREGTRPVVIATKFFPYPYRLSAKSLSRALQGSLRRLGLPRIDLYQIHWYTPLLSIEALGNALADAVESGLVRAVGVSNYSRTQMEQMYRVLERRGVPLASNQVKYNLIERDVETNGILQACRDLGVTLIAYSPLAMGVLTGRYTTQNPPPGTRGRLYQRDFLARLEPLLARMRAIGESHGDKTPAQVALNWLILKGTLPIPGAKNARHAASNAGALGWSLTGDECAELEELSRKATAA